MTSRFRAWVLPACLLFVWLANSVLVAPPARAAQPLAQSLEQMDVTALRLAINDLTTTFGDRYRNGPAFLKRLEMCEQRLAEIRAALRRGDHSADQKVPALVTDFRRLQQDALLANPLLDFDRLLLVKRGQTR